MVIPLSSFLVLCVISVALVARLASLYSEHDVLHLCAWIAAQWTPMTPLRNVVEVGVWNYWNRRHHTQFKKQRIISVDVQQHGPDLLSHLEKHYGTGWRKKPLILRNLWTEENLADSSRTLSKNGLLQLELEIPYFTDARRKDALTPDSKASVSKIVQNITQGAPHKIGSQWIVQKNTSLIEEIAPVDIVTELFGNYFSPSNVRGSGHFGFAKMTTVPVFVARGEATSDENPFTALHCEPISNIAVQLSGSKRWTILPPEYSFMVKPALAKDGRAFFASWSDNYSEVPIVTAETRAGDAIWLPTWTWHRVDYTPSREISISGSLFHFRAYDFVTSNPLFSVLVLPAILKELVGLNTQ